MSCTTAASTFLSPNQICPHCSQSQCGTFFTFLRLAALIFLMSVGAPAHAALYRIRPLGIVGGRIVGGLDETPLQTMLDSYNAGAPRPAMSMNGLGQVVEDIGINGTSLLWLPAPAFGLPGGYSYLPNGFMVQRIGPAGDVVGIMVSNRTAAIWRKGALTNLGKMGLDAVANVDVTFRGVVVGTAIKANPQPVEPRYLGTPFIVPPGGTQLQQMFTNDTVRTWVFRADANADVVGCETPVSGPSRVFITQNGSGLQPGGKQYPVLPPNGYAVSLNGFGDIAGVQYGVSGPLDDNLFTYAPSGQSDLPTTPVLLLSSNVQPTDLLAMNIRGQALCIAGFDPGDVLYQHGGFTRLQDLIPLNSGWTDLSGADLNDNGWIVGEGTYQGQIDQAFLMVPVGLSASLAAIPNPVPVGAPVTVTLTLSNETAAALGPVTLTNVGPNFNPSVDGSGGLVYSNGPASAQVASLSPGATATFVYTYATSAPGTNHLYAIGHGFDSSTRWAAQRFLASDYATTIVAITGQLDGTLSVSPPRVQTNGLISVTLTARNNPFSPGPVSNVAPSGTLTVEGSGDAQLLQGPNPTNHVSLHPGDSTNFNYVFRAVKAGRVDFRGRVAGVGVGGSSQQSDEAVSASVLIAPGGDLLIKRHLESDSQYSGENVYQRVPIAEQARTNAVGQNQSSVFEVKIENHDAAPQVFSLITIESTSNGWSTKYVFEGQDISDSLRSGAQFPPLASNQVDIITIQMDETNAAAGSTCSAELFLSSPQVPAETLDSVKAVSQLDPQGDLLIRRDGDPAGLYAGAGIFQTAPASPQIRTNIVDLNQDSKFQVQIQNTDTQPQTYTLAALPKGNTGWKRTYLMGGQDMTAQLEAAGGANLPQLAAGASSTLEVIVRATNALASDLEPIDFTLTLASDPTRPLDIVEAVSQRGLPDLTVISMAWNPTNSGLDFVYANRGSALSNDTVAQIVWATGPSTNDILSQLPPIYTVHVPTGFSDQSTNQATEAHFNYPPTNATYVQLVLDPDNLINESSRTNNTLALPLTFRHVVLVMMENRSFDHFLGWLPGADGMLSGGFYTNTSGEAFTNYHLTYFQGCGCDDPDHTYIGARIALNTNTSPPGCDGWLRANPHDTFSIGYYLQNDLGFFGQIAPNWTVCDRYFAAIMAETQPNRIYQHAGQTDCLTNRTTFQLTLPTIWDLLQSSNVTARYYYDGETFAQTPLFLWGLKYYSLEHRTSQFYSDCASGSLPSVSYVDPELTSATLFAYAHDEGLTSAGIDTGGNDDHPHSDIRNGEAFLSRVYNAIASSPQWSSTVLIINFDEWGGFFDHVVPPVLPSSQVPDADASAYIGGGLFSTDPTYGSRGFRVPCVVISPWTHQSRVSSGLFDHTSVLKLIEDRWNLPSLTAHDFYANDLTNVMDFGHPDYTVPPLLQNVPSGSPYGGFCQSVLIKHQSDGSLLVDWDATCIKAVVLQSAPDPDGPWFDVSNILAPPYVFTPSKMEFFRFKSIK